MIYLVRHGQTIANTKSLYCGVNDSPLTEKGVRQSKKAVDSLKNKTIDIIYSSQRERCQYIAKALSEALGIEYVTDKRLNEFNFGILENLTYEEIQDRHPDVLNRWLNESDYIIPEGESRALVDKRLSNFLKTESHNLQSKNVAVIAHQGTNIKLLCQLLNIARENIWHFRINNGAVVKIDNDKGFYYMVID